MKEDKTNSQQLETVIVEKLIAYKNSEKANGTASGAMSKQLMAKEITSLFRDLFESSIKDNHYFFDCAMGVYEHTFKERYDTHKRLFSASHPEDDIQISFLKHEIKNLHEQQANRIIGGEGYANFVQGVDDFIISTRCKKIYLKEKLNALNWTFYPEIYDGVSFADPTPEQFSFEHISTLEPILTYKDISAAQIILLLDEIGFYQLEKIKGIGSGNIAAIISFITRGLNADNLESKKSDLVSLKKNKNPKYLDDAIKVNNFLSPLIK